MGEIPCRDWAVGAGQVGSVNWRFLAPPTGCWHCGGAWSGGGRCARPPANVWHPYRGGSCRGASGWRAKRRGFGTGLWRRTFRFVGFVDACSTGSRDAEATSPQDPDWAMAIAEYLRSTPWCDSQAGSLRHDGGHRSPPFRGRVGSPLASPESVWAVRTKHYQRHEIGVSICWQTTCAVSSRYPPNPGGQIHCFISCTICVH
jgi:hypothetical protein